MGMRVKKKKKKNEGKGGENRQILSNFIFKFDSLFFFIYDAFKYKKNELIYL